MTTTKTRLFIGLETSEKNLEIAPEEITAKISEYVTAGTFLEAKGLWMGDLENSIVFEVIDLSENMTPEFKDELEDSNTDDPVEYLKSVLETEFNQESVMIEQSEVQVQF